MTAINYVLRDIEELRRHWVWFLILGIALVVLGMVAIGSATLATVATMLLFGWLLTAGGVLQIIHAFWARRWGGFFIQLLVGVLQLVIGVMVANHPLATGTAVTLLMAVFFVIGGMFRLAAAVALPFDGRGWLFLSGVIDLVMGMMIWQRWPNDALWVIGLFVGVDLLIHGWWLVMLSLSVKSMPTPTAAQ
jgi:uncharacterized membrane protein HdeD (DUF308 family)